MKENLIAPCGMNCGVCLHYLRMENKCPGCYTGRKVNDRPIKCSRRLCNKRKGDYCFECDSFPCESIKKLDERYRKRYGMSMIENLKYNRENGIEKFLEREQNKWVKDGKVLCVHDRTYY